MTQNLSSELFPQNLSMWMCDICTFINDNLKLTCEICLNNHPNKILHKHELFSQNLSSESIHKHKREHKQKDIDNFTLSIPANTPIITVTNTYTTPFLPPIITITPTTLTTPITTTTTTTVCDVERKYSLDSLIENISSDESFEENSDESFEEINEENSDEEINEGENSDESFEEINFTKLKIE